MLGAQLCSRLRELPNQTGTGSRGSEGISMWVLLPENTVMYKLSNRFDLEENCIEKHFTELLCVVRENRVSYIIRT